MSYHSVVQHKNGKILEYIGSAKSLPEMHHVVDQWMNIEQSFKPFGCLEFSFKYFDWSVFAMNESGNRVVVFSTEEQSTYVQIQNSNDDD
jgi:hypothetical protein